MSTERKKIYRVEIVSAIYRDYEAENASQAEDMAYADTEVVELLENHVRDLNYTAETIAEAEIPEDGSRPDFSDRY